MSNTISTISIPKHLADQLRDRMKETDFNLLNDYVSHLLDQIISKESNKGSADDEEKVKERLRSLGYLD